MCKRITDRKQTVYKRDVHKTQNVSNREKEENRDSYYQNELITCDMISENYYCRDNRSFENFVTKRSFSVVSSSIGDSDTYSGSTGTGVSNGWVGV